MLSASSFIVEMDYQMYKTGWIVGLAAIGVMLTMSSVQIGNLDSWDQALTTKFIAQQLANVGSVIAAFVGGKLIPQPERNG